MKYSERTEDSRQKMKARAYLFTYVERGKVDKPDHCENCGAPCVPEAHHTDYSKPLEVVWLCRGCRIIRVHQERVLPG